ncbi:hypothetical protein KCP73_23280 [Salmonella enterica subsp. enterica]|nr:hypothetical protein KCP73_23280 [Salmonella enterica subsp. enterica]
MMVTASYPPFARQDKRSMSSFQWGTLKVCGGTLLMDAAVRVNTRSTACKILWSAARAHPQAAAAQVKSVPMAAHH